jgi:hypothetical protein
MEIGDKQFDNFELLLEGTLHDRWERITSAVASKTFNTFKDAVLALVKIKVPKDDALQIQQEHLRQVKKNDCLSPLAILQNHWKISTCIPNSCQVLQGMSSPTMSSSGSYTTPCQSRGKMSSVKTMVI